MNEHKELKEEIKEIWQYLWKKEDEQYKRIGDIRVNKSAVAGFFVSVTFGIARIVLDKYEFSEWGGDMELIRFLLSLVSTDLLFLVPILLGVGIILKKLTDLSNELIPALLFLFVAFPVCAVVGFFISANTGFQKVLDCIGRYGIFQGFLLTALSVTVYDIVHGIKKYGSDKKILEGNNG